VARERKLERGGGASPSESWIAWRCRVCSTGGSTSETEQAARVRLRECQWSPNSVVWLLEFPGSVKHNVSKGTK